MIERNVLQWTGLGCDVCGFGTVEDVDAFDPRRPCPECGAVMLPASDAAAERPDAIKCGEPERGEPT